MGAPREGDVPARERQVAKAQLARTAPDSAPRVHVLLADIPPHVLLPAEHPLATKSEVSLRDLASEPMVLLDVPPSSGYFTSLFDQVGLEPMIRFRSPSFEMVRGLVGHGFGYALLATKPANNMTYDGRALTTRPLAEEAPGSRFVLVRRKGAPSSQAIEAFLAHCRGQIDHRLAGAA